MNSEKIKRFAAIIRPFLDNSESHIEEVRRISKKQGSARDWPWNRFVHAFASNGGSKHWDDKIKPNYKKYAWAAIESLSGHERKKRLEYATNPRRRTRNGERWLSRSFEQVFQRVRKAGGPKAIKKEYNAITKSEGRIAYWKQFPGIGDKYAREIPMRSYDPFFLKDRFAVDARLRRLLKIMFKKPV